MPTRTTASTARTSTSSSIISSRACGRPPSSSWTSAARARSDDRHVPLVRVRALRPNDVATVRRLVQLYIYDLGGEHWDVEPDGTFARRAWHRRFWSRHGRQHFMIL